MIAIGLTATCQGKDSAGFPAAHLYALQAQEIIDEHHLIGLQSALHLLAGFANMLRNEPSTPNSTPPSRKSNDCPLGNACVAKYARAAQARFARSHRTNRGTVTQQ